MNPTDTTTLQFQHPQILWLLPTLLPLLTYFLYTTWKKRQQHIRTFIQSPLLARLTTGHSPKRQLQRRALLLIATTLILIALARPQYGHQWQTATQQALDIILAIDTSKSMLANDIQPNRLQRARLAALDLLTHAQQDRLGLVAFAGTAYLQCPLTLDNNAFKQNLDTLTTQTILHTGTALNQALKTAQQAHQPNTQNHRAIILITDGEDHQPNTLQTAQQIAQQNTRIYTIGIGTPQGELLQTTDNQGNHTYHKDHQGNPIKSRLNEPHLKQIAQIGNGAYTRLHNTQTIQNLYNTHLKPLPKNQITTRPTKTPNEQYQWPLTLALLTLITQTLITNPKPKKPTQPPTTQPT